MSHFEELKNWDFDIFLPMHNFLWLGILCSCLLGQEQQSSSTLARDEFVRSKMRSSKQLSLEIKSRWKSSKGHWVSVSEVPGRQERPSSLILLVMWFEYSYRVWCQAVSHGKLAHTLSRLFNNRLLWDVGAESRIPLITLLKSGEVVGPEHKPGVPEMECCIDSGNSFQESRPEQRVQFSMEFYNMCFSFLLSLTKQLMGGRVVLSQSLGAHCAGEGMATRAAVLASLLISGLHRSGRAWGCWCPADFAFSFSCNADHSC